MNPRHPRLVGLAASIALVAVLVGLPAVLLGLGWGATPASPAGWWTALTSPDDGHLTVMVLEGVAWIVWALLAVTILAEAVAALRGRQAPRLPGLRWSQIPARKLVAAALLLFIAVPTLVVSSAPAAPAAPTPPSPAPLITGQSTIVPASPRLAALPQGSPAAATHTVRRGESLWSIAEHYLGSGVRYREIAELNQKLLHGKPGFLRPGWVLILPAEAHATGDQADATGEAPLGSGYTVAAGDTLSAIADRHLGDARVWPRIFQASRNITQPDGRHLTNPNLILPGWSLTIPSVQTPEVPAGTASGPAAAPSSKGPTVAPVPSTVTTQPTQTERGGAVSAPVTSSGATTTSTTTQAPAADSDSTHRRAPQLGSDQVSTATPPWLLVGLSGAGALLAAGLLASLRRRRRAQFRARRPGRTIPAPPTELIPVEKTLITEGTAASPTTQTIDEALKLLGASGTDPDTVPQLESVQLLAGVVAVQLAEPVTLAQPWRPGGADGRRWLLADGTHGQTPTARAPYPLLVSVGQAADGTTWMLNLEQLGTISVTGDPTYAADFARYVAAEIAVNPWSRQVELDCVGIAAEAVPLDPARIHHYRLDDPAALDAATNGAVTTINRCAEHDVTAAAGRVDDLGDDVWASWLILADAALTSTPLQHLGSLIADHPARAGTTIVMIGDTDPLRGVAIQLSGDGKVHIPTLGLDLIAVGLTPDEAEGCALLLAHADQLDDVDMPIAGDEGWREYCDSAGAIRDELVLPRDAEPTNEPTSTVISAPDAEVLAVTAATPDDLNQLAPQVPDHIRSAVESSDPDLDTDLAAWAAGTRPQLRLLGPVQAHTGTTGNPSVVAKRKAFYAELLAFLALHPQGVSTDQLVDAFATDAVQMRVHASRVRAWLGIDPSTNQPYLPEAAKSPAAVTRGIHMYQLVGVLTDIDLFRRLRARGQARGPEGITDLQTALGLVTGEPFTGQRDGGWAWLADDIRIDQHMVCAVVDVAHLVTMAALHAGDPLLARTATETALMAAPYEDTPHLDLAAVLAAEGDQQAAERVLNRDVCNRIEDDEPPDDLPPRTADLVPNPPWLRRGRVA